MEQTIINALRVAAVQYEIDAQKTRDTPRVAEQLRRQVKEANDLADRIEENGLRLVIADER